MSLSALLGAWMEASDTLEAHVSRCRSAHGCDSCVRLVVKEVEASAAYRHAVESE
jgi:hypothetical protein